jgi:hypothetical protein
MGRGARGARGRGRGEGELSSPNSLTSSDAKKNLVYTGKLVGVSSLF